MRRRIVTVWLVVAIPALAACGGSSNSASQGGAGVAQAGGPAKADKAADEAALRAIYQKMPGQVMSGDTAAFGALFGNDGIELMPGAPPAQGAQAVNKELVSALGMMKNLSMSMGDVVVTVAEAGDLAVVRAPYHMTYTDPKGKKAEDHGSSMTVFHKVDGQWKILYDLNVSETAPQ
jgi:uncharacterized protein (TIGR02246 family)